MLSRGDTKFNPTLWTRDQLEFKFGVPTSLAARKNACKVEWWLSVNASGNAIPPIFQEITPRRAAAFRPVVMPFGLLLIGPCLFTCREQRLPQISG